MACLRVIPKLPASAGDEWRFAGRGRKYSHESPAHSRAAAFNLQPRWSPGTCCWLTVNRNGTGHTQSPVPACDTIETTPCSSLLFTDIAHVFQANPAANRCPRCGLVTLFMLHPHRSLNLIGERISSALGRTPHDDSCPWMQDALGLPASPRFLVNLYSSS